MPRITYHEFRPGHWVKLVDGKAVGPATEEEVAQWRRERKAQERIWKDVVQEVAPAEEEPPDEEALRQQQAAIWDAVLSQESRSARRVTGASEEPQEAARPVRPKGTRSSPTTRRRRSVPREPPQPEPKPKPTPRAAQVKPETTPTPAAPAAEKVPPPQPKSTPPKEPLATPVPARSEPPAAKEKPQPSVEAKALSVKTAPAPEPEPPAPPTAKAQASEAPFSAAAKTVVKPEPEAAPSKVEEPRALAAAPAVASSEAKAAAKAVPRERAAPKVEQLAPLKEPSKPVKQVEMEETEPPEPVAAEAMPSELPAPTRRPRRTAARPRATEPVAEAAPPEEPEPAEEVEAEAPPAPPAPTRRRRKAQTTTRRRSHRAPDKPAEPSYLWMAAGPSEDLVTAVRTGLARYEERFSEPAGAVLCHEHDLPTLEKAGFGVDVRHGKHVSPRNFWIGPK